MGLALGLGHTVQLSKCQQRDKLLRERTGESLSFTAFITTCLGRAVDENKSLQAIRFGRKQLVLFEEVDVATFIERKVTGHSQPINAWTAPLRPDSERSQ